MADVSLYNSYSRYAGQALHRERRYAYREDTEHAEEKQTFSFVVSLCKLFLCVLCVTAFFRYLRNMSNQLVLYAIIAQASAESLVKNRL